MRKTQERKTILFVQCHFSGLKAENEQNLKEIPIWAEENILDLLLNGAH